MQRTTRREFLEWSAGGVAFSLLGGALPGQAAAAEPGAATGRYNVLFIAVDDLRPQAGCYGHPKMHTPNIDRLAASGTLFDRAYCQQAVCSPSRTSLLTGRRPDTTRVYDLETHFRLHLPDVVTLPEYFKRQGYQTQGYGKIYHGGLDDPQSWSVKHWDPKGPGYLKPESLAEIERQRAQLRAEGKTDERPTVLDADPEKGITLKVRQPRRQARGPAWEDPDCADNDLADGKTADEVIRAMQELKDKRFFLAAGFLKPHLPFVAPKRYYDLYPPGSITLADNPFPPKDCPAIALHNSGELRSYSGIPGEGPIPDATALELIRGYYAATSYVDAQIGRLLDELDRLGLADKTVVVLWGDHGWQLGEHGLWCKHTNFETSAHVLLLCRAPGRPAGRRSERLVEFVDIYPTLCQCCGLEVPAGLEGLSFAPLLETPDRPWKRAAFSQYPRDSYMGWSMRTDRYRYTEWGLLGQTPVGVELYDHQADPGENTNLAGRPEHRDLVARLSLELHQGWRAALPA